MSNALQPRPSAQALQTAALVRCELSGPRGPLNAAIWQAIFAAVHSTSATAALEIYVAEDRVAFVVASDAASLELLKRAIGGVSQAVAITPFQPLTASGTHPMLAALHRAAVPLWAPLSTMEDFQDTDPVGALLEAVQPLVSEESVLIRFVLRNASSTQYDKAYKGITRALYSGTIWDLFAMFTDSLRRGPKFQARVQRRLEERLERPLFDVVGEVALSGPEPSRLRTRAESLAAAFWGQFNAGFGGLALQLVESIDSADPPTLLLNADELAALWHLPSELVSTPGVKFVKHAPSTLPSTVLRTDGLLLGLHAQRGDTVSVHLSRQDLDSGHLVCLGRTGVGKSTLMHHLLAQLIAQPDRPGLWVLDPNNDLQAGLALSAIPQERRDDVVLVDLGDTDFPVGLPLFSTPKGVSREAMIQTTFAMLRSIFKEHWSETRMADTVFALTTTLCSIPGATLMDAPRLFDDSVIRRQALMHLNDPVALEFWSDYESLSKGAQRELVRPVLYRLRSFYRSAAVRNIVCRTDGIDFTDLLDKVVLVALNGPEVQAESDLLGELLIARLHLAALSRLSLPLEHRRRTYLACDESQRFKGASLPVLWSEGRKLGITLMMSTQFIDGWSEALADAVMGNTGTLIAFRCGPNDSRRLANTLRPFTSEQVEDLNRFEAIVKLQSGGITIPAFDISTRPLTGRPDPDAYDRMRANTRKRYGRPRAEVEAELNARHRDTATPDWDWSDLDAS